MKSNLDMAALFNRMAVRDSSCRRCGPGRGDHAEVIEWPPSPESSEEEKHDREEDQRELRKGKQFMASADATMIPTPYFLTCGSTPAISSSSSSHSSRKDRHQQLSSDSLTSPSWLPSASLQICSKQSDHVEALISELESSISALRAAFLPMRASSGSHTAADACSKARMAMAGELQKLSDLQTRLSSLIDRHNSGHSLQGQDAKLKSYEGIIARFHAELQKKDAVVEALKETLAKSILRGEKLERRIKALQAKLSSLL